MEEQFSLIGASGLISDYLILMGKIKPQYRHRTAVHMKNIFLIIAKFFKINIKVKYQA